MKHFILWIARKLDYSIIDINDYYLCIFTLDRNWKTESFPCFIEFEKAKRLIGAEWELVRKNSISNNQ